MFVNAAFSYSKSERRCNALREKKEVNVRIGARVREARERLSMTQEQLAEKLDCSPQFVSDLERGVVGLSIPTLKGLCLALGVSSDSILFDGTPERGYKAIEDKCRPLTDAQYRLLAEIIDKYIEAVNLS